MDWHPDLDRMDVPIAAFEVGHCPSHHQKAQSDLRVHFYAWRECAEDGQPSTCSVLDRWNKSTRQLDQNGAGGFGVDASLESEG